MFEQRGMSIFMQGAQESPPHDGREESSIKIPESEISLPEAEEKPTPKAFPRFAKKFKKPGIQPNDSMMEAGRKVFRYQIGQMLSQEGGARDGENIEALHDMRVATRRLRAAFEVFGPYLPPKSLKPFRRGLRDVGRALGRVRDLDVFIAAAVQYMKDLSEDEGKEFSNFLQTWREERERARQSLILLLDGETYSNVIQGIGSFVERGASDAGVVLRDGGLASASLVRDLAPVLIYTHLSAVRSFDLELGSASFERLHALRRSFKYLRYTIEFFKEVLGEEVEAVIGDLKAIQDHLGALNDANTACTMLNKFQVEWENRQVAVPILERKSLDIMVTYLAYRLAERHRLLVSFPGVWYHFNRPEFRHNLAVAISAL
jgi:CHAD domain-containing protein